MHGAADDASHFPLPCWVQTGATPVLAAPAAVTCCAAEGFATWMDAGPGTMANLQLHIPLASLDAVVISHSHPDHWSDLEGLYVAMRYFLGRQGFPVYAPEGLRDLMRGENRDGTLDWRVIGDGDSAQVGPATLDLVADGPPGGDVGFQGRSRRPSARLLGRHRPGVGAEQAGTRASQLALVEACLSLEAEGIMQHLSARQAGATAADAGAERLVITHLAPPIDRAVAQAGGDGCVRRPCRGSRGGKTWAI